MLLIAVAQKSDNSALIYDLQGCRSKTINAVDESSLLPVSANEITFAIYEQLDQECDIIPLMSVRVRDQTTGILLDVNAASEEVIIDAMKGIYQTVKTEIDDIFAVRTKSKTLH